MTDIEYTQDTRSTDEVIVAMLTENTGRHFLDSGGAYGRNWERNSGKTVADFKSQPSATLEIWRGGDDENPRFDISCTVSVFHLLHHALSLDEYCRIFNGMECGNWNGEYYGTDQGQCDWLDENGFQAVGDGFNTYNWASNHSQILQGQELERDGENYILLQVHGGCDARGGYTNAKLFKLDHGIEAVLLDHCGFSVDDGEGGYLSLDWSGEWITSEGQGADDEYIAKFCTLAGDERTLHGDFYPYY